MGFALLHHDWSYAVRLSGDCTQQRCRRQPTEHTQTNRQHNQNFSHVISFLLVKECETLYNAFFSTVLWLCFSELRESLSLNSCYCGEEWQEKRSFSVLTAGKLHKTDANHWPILSIIIGHVDIANRSIRARVYPLPIILRLVNDWRSDLLTIHVEDAIGQNRLAGIRIAVSRNKGLNITVLIPRKGMVVPGSRIAAD